MERELVLKVNGHADGPALFVGLVELLDHAGAWAAVLLLEDDELIATAGTSGWLA